MSTMLLSNVSRTAMRGGPQLNSITGLLLPRSVVSSHSAAAVSTTATCDAKFKRKFKANMTASNPLIDGPDFSYADGRKVPLGTRLRERLIKQRGLVEDVLRMLGELEYAKNRHQVMTAEEQQKREHAIATKLQPKEHLKLDPGTGELQQQRGQGGAGRR